MSNALKILSRPNGNAEEYGRWSCNPYKGCPHGCTYCYLHRGPWKKGLGGNKPVLKEGIVNESHAYHLAMAEIIANREQICRDGGLFMTFTSDPCTPETRDLFFRIAANSYVPVMMLTKRADFMRSDYEWVPQMRMFDLYFPTNRSDRIAFGFTLTGYDEMEPHASPNMERIEAIRWLHEHGYRTWASIEPVIDFETAYNMTAQAVAAGCEHVKIGLMTNNTHVCRSMYDTAACVAFINDVMTMTQGLATVYWKQSFRDFLRGTRKSPLLSDHQIDKILMAWSHSVDMTWSMFDIQKTIEL